MNGNNVESGVSPTDFKIQDIITAKKAERKLKAEAMRQEALRRIEAMTSRSGMDPTGLFSKEIWEKIIANLGPWDRGNISQVHPYFRDLLKANRVRDILFPQLVEVDEFRKRIRTKSSQELEYEVESYFGNALGTLRRVSKSMRNGVDGWIEDKITENLEVEDHLFAYPLLLDRQIVDKILTSFEGPHPGKRFFPRGLLVAVPSWGYHDHGHDEHVGEIKDEDNRLINRLNELENMITALLQIMGDQIWQLHFVIGRDEELECGWEREDTELGQVYLTLRKYTLLTPNLKWLDVEFTSSIPEEKIISLPSSFMDDAPFPHLHALEKVFFQCRGLQVHGAIKLEALRICEAVLGGNPHLKQLLFSGIDDTKLEFLPVKLIQSLPLTTLVVHSFDHDDHLSKEDFSMSFRCIQPILNFNWKLKEIFLDISEPSVPLTCMLRFLERFPTLEDVTLSFRKPAKVGFYGDTFAYLSLPSLTHFGLRFTQPEMDFGNGNNIHFLFSLQFLLHCEKLKNLYWTMLDFDDGKLRDHLKKLEGDDMIDFRAGMKVLYESNIWEVFPNLKYVKVENRKMESEGACKHEYKRSDVGKGMQAFLGKHSCCKPDCVNNCVLLTQ